MFRSATEPVPAAEEASATAPSLSSAARAIETHGMSGPDQHPTPNEASVTGADRYTEMLAPNEAGAALHPHGSYPVPEGCNLDGACHASGRWVLEEESGRDPVIDR